MTLFRSAAEGGVDTTFLQGLIGIPGNVFSPKLNEKAGELIDTRNPGGAHAAGAEPCRLVKFIQIDIEAATRVRRHLISWPQHNKSVCFHSFPCPMMHAGHKCQPR